jgi:hypothetical protein
LKPPERKRGSEFLRHQLARSFFDEDFGAVEIYLVEEKLCMFEEELPTSKAQ